VEYASRDAGSLNTKFIDNITIKAEVTINTDMMKQMHFK